MLWDAKPIAKINFKNSQWVFVGFTNSTNIYISFKHDKLLFITISKLEKEYLEKAYPDAEIIYIN